MIETRFRKQKGRAVQYLKENGSWCTTGKDTIAEARIWYKETIIGKNGVLFSDFSDGFFTDETVGSFKWVSIRAKRNTNPEWWALSAMVLDKYILPYFQDTLLTDISPVLVQDWYFSLKGTRKKELSDESRNKYLNVLSTMLSWAVHQSLIDSNPCKSIYRIVSDRKGREKFTDEEMEMMFPDDIISAISVWKTLKYATYFYILKDTGWRHGEIAALTPDGFFEDVKGIFTSRSVDSFTRSVKDTIKTSTKGYDYKIGFLTTTTSVLLRELIRDKKCNELIFEVDGLPMISNSIRTHYRRCMNRLGIDIKGRPPYSLRTTFMSRISKSESDESVKELMGHKAWHRCYDKRTPIELLESARSKLISRH